MAKIKKKKAKPNYLKIPQVGAYIQKMLPAVQKAPFIDIARALAIESLRLHIDTTLFTQKDFDEMCEDMRQIKTEDKFIEYLYNTMLECEGMGVDD